MSVGGCWYLSQIFRKNEEQNIKIKWIRMEKNYYKDNISIEKKERERER